MDPPPPPPPAEQPTAGQPVDPGPMPPPAVGVPQHPQQDYAMPQHPQQAYAMPQHPQQAYAMPQHPQQAYAMPQHPQQAYAMPPPPVVMNRPYNPKPEKSDIPMLLMIGSICCLPICCPCALVYYIVEEDNYKQELKKWNQQEAANRQIEQETLVQAMHMR